MATLLQQLGEFNRKERFYLVGMALGNEIFRLSEAFRKTLGQTLGVQVPENAFVAMDYHLDWLAASLYLTANPDASPPYERHGQLITATQQDIDLLVAYEAKGTSHVIMLEAKGVTGYSNPQFRSKAKRLLAISQAMLWEMAHACPHFALISPKQPQRLDYEKCPSWMMGSDGRVSWIRLHLPDTLKKVVRCTQSGTASQQGDHWKVVSERHGKALVSKP